MSLFLTFAIAGVATFGLRTALIVGHDRFDGLDWFNRYISLVSPAAMAAIVVSSIVVSEGAVGVPSPVVVVAMAFGAYGVHRTGNVVAALTCGLPIYWLGALVGLV